MAIANKKRLYNKALRILHREITALDKKSKQQGLTSLERSDLVKMIKPLEAEIKDDKPAKKQTVPSSILIKRAEEVLKELAKDAHEAEENKHHEEES